MRRNFLDEESVARTSIEDREVIDRILASDEHAPLCHASLPYENQKRRHESPQGRESDDKILQDHATSTRKGVRRKGDGEPDEEEETLLDAMKKKSKKVDESKKMENEETSGRKRFAKKEEKTTAIATQKEIDSFFKPSRKLDFDKFPGAGMKERNTRIVRYDEGGQHLGIGTLNQCWLGSLLLL